MYQATFICVVFFYPRIFQTVGYMYWFDLELDILRFLWALSIVTILSVTISWKNQFLKLYLKIQDFMLLLPLLAVFSYVDFYFLLTTLPLLGRFTVIFTVIAVERIRKNTLFKTKVRQLNKLKISKFLMLCSLLLATVFIYLSGADFELLLQPLSLYKSQYELREGLSFSFPYSYIVNWSTFIINPLLFERAYRRDYFACAFLIMASLMNYIVLPFTIIPLSAFLLFGLGFIWQLMRSNSITLYVWVILFLALSDQFLIDMIINRTIYIPALTQLLYYEFFLENNLNYFSGSFLQFSVSQYVKSLGFVIDDAYYGGVGTNQSTGNFASVFANAGVIGIIIFGMLIGIVIRIISSDESESVLKVGFIIVLSISFINFPFQQLFLTNGFLLILLILIMKGSENGSIH